VLMCVSDETDAHKKAVQGTMQMVQEERISTGRQPGRQVQHCREPESTRGVWRAAA